MSCINHLTFSIPSGRTLESPLQIRLHQASTKDENQGENETNTGFIMWPSAVMLSHYLSNNPHVLRGDDTPDGDVMELGSGCGLAGLTAAALMQNDGSTSDDKVVFTDYNRAVLENLKRNIELNDFVVQHEVLALDWFDQQPLEDSSDPVEKEANTWVDMDGTSHGQFRLIIGADLLVCTNDAELVAATIYRALMEGGRALILGPSSNRRFGLATFPDACREKGMTVTVDENILDANRTSGFDTERSRQKLMNGLELGGYNQRANSLGHDFTVFTIDKPITTTSYGLG
eukprot:CCRYP_006723-RA/>CCRYP_006723-RA protein AED:0.37 eAED:0.37 QI:0/1/0.5/1/0/0.5/2/263/287